MDFDIKAKIEEIIAKIKGDPGLLDDFGKEPEKTVERVAGTDIPDGWLDKIIEGVKAAFSGGKIKETIENIGDKIGGIFGKKEDKED